MPVGACDRKMILAKSYDYVFSSSWTSNNDVFQRRIFSIFHKGPYMCCRYGPCVIITLGDITTVEVGLAFLSHFAQIKLFLFEREIEKVWKIKLVLFVHNLIVAQRNTASSRQAASLALRVIIVCFHRKLTGEWFWLSNQIKDFAQIHSGIHFSLLQTLLSISTH